MKKLLVFFMIFLFLISGGVKGEETELQQLNINSAIDRVLEKNLDLKIARLDLDKAELQYKKEKASNLSSKSRYSEMQAKYNFKTAENNYETTYNDLLQQVIDLYTQVWLQKMNIGIKEKQVKLESELLKKAEAEREIGEISRVELLEQQNTFKDAEFNLETARDNYNQSLRELKNLLGIKEASINLKDIKAPEIWNIKVSEAVEKALKNSKNLQLKKEAVELASIDLNKAEVTSSRLDKQIKEIELKKAELSRENTEENIKSNTREKFYQFKQSVKQMNLKKERLKEAAQKYNLQQEQYQAGLITQTDVLQYEINMIQARHDYRSAIATYYQNEFVLKNAMKVDINPVEVFAYENYQE